MAVEIITPRFDSVTELKRLLKALGNHPSLSIATGPKYMFFTTKTDGSIVTLDCDVDLDGICSQICGHLLTLADMGYPLIEAAKMDFLAGTVGTNIEVSQSTTAQPDKWGGVSQQHIEITDPKVKLVFKELGPEDGRWCDLTFIRF